MKYEVEQKFYVGDLRVTEQALRALGWQSNHAISQTDIYLSHPTRDFGKTDEALRLRREGEANFITYKGPKIDQTTKTRLELELPLPNGEEFATQFRELLAVLSFGVVVEVKKQRRRALVTWQGATIEVALDEVERLGTFVELETVAEEAELATARQRVVSLAEELGLTQNERLSYCELMLKRLART
jgi:adenylate cyclase class 2